MNKNLSVEGNHIHRWVYECDKGSCFDVDDFLGRIVLYASLYGHSSGWLGQLGIPTDGGPTGYYPNPKELAAEIDLLGDRETENGKGKTMADTKQVMIEMIESLKKRLEKLELKIQSDEREGRIFNDLDLEFVVELTKRVDENKSFQDLLSGDNDCRLCHILHMALEFDRLVDLDSPVREQIADNIVRDELLIDIELTNGKWRW